LSLKFITEEVVGHISRMQTRVEKKDLELEKVVGNLLIVEYQVERLREELVRILGLIPLT